MEMVARRTRRSLAYYLAVLPFVVFSLFPFYWMVVTSFKQNSEIYDLRAIPFWFRVSPTLEHYVYLFQRTAFLTWMGNTIVVAGLSTIAAVVISILAGYALARLRFRGGDTLGGAIFAVYLVPTTLLFIPLSEVVRELHLSDTRSALVVTYPTFLVPFATWLIMSYFRTIPQELEESAWMDGCSRLGGLVRVVLPAAIPGVLTAMLFSFTLSWNEFIYAVMFVSSTAKKTLGSGVVVELICGDVFYWGADGGGGPRLRPHRGRLRFPAGLLHLRSHGGGRQVKGGYRGKTTGGVDTMVAGGKRQ
jgi:multiple sugar transport system permease protein